MRSRVDLGRTGTPSLLAARIQHEQHRNGDERNGREKQHGGRDQKDRSYNQSKNDISSHAILEEAIICPGREEQTSRRWARVRAGDPWSRWSS
jgi:hypothetical protein